MKHILLFLLLFSFVKLNAQSTVLDGFAGYANIFSVSGSNIVITGFYGNQKKFGDFFDQSELAVDDIVWSPACARFKITAINGNSITVVNQDPTNGVTFVVGERVGFSRETTINGIVFGTLPQSGDGNGGFISGIGNNLSACIYNHYNQALKSGMSGVGKQISLYTGASSTTNPLLLVPPGNVSPNPRLAQNLNGGQLYYNPSGSLWQPVGSQYSNVAEGNGVSQGYQPANRTSGSTWQSGDIWTNIYSVGSGTGSTVNEILISRGGGNGSLRNIVKEHSLRYDTTTHAIQSIINGLKSTSATQTWSWTGVEHDPTVIPLADNLKPSVGGLITGTEYGNIKAAYNWLGITRTGYGLGAGTTPAGTFTGSAMTNPSEPTSFKAAINKLSGVVDNINTSIGSSTPITTMEISGLPFTAGKRFRTSGYNSSGDGGDADFLVYTSGSSPIAPNGVTAITVSGSTNVAVMQPNADGGINVAQCGATSGGSSDDTAAFQAAINSFGYVYTGSNKTYFINSRLLLKSNLRLEIGTGTVIDKNNAVRDLMVLGDGSVTDTLKNIEISGGTWKKTGGTYSSDASAPSFLSSVWTNAKTYGFVFYRCHNVFIHDVIFEDFPDYCLDAGQVSSFKIWNVRLKTSHNGIVIEGLSKNIDIKNITGTTGEDFITLINNATSRRYVSGAIDNVSIENITQYNGKNTIALIPGNTGAAHLLFSNININNVTSYLLSTNNQILIGGAGTTFSDPMWGGKVTKLNVLNCYLPKAADQYFLLQKNNELSESSFSDLSFFNNTSTFINFDKGTVRNVKLSNFKISNTAISPIILSSTSIENLTFDNADLTFTDSGSEMYGAIKIESTFSGSVHVQNSKFTGAGGRQAITSISAYGLDLRLSNVYFKTYGSVFRNYGTSTSNIIVTACVFDAVNQPFATENSLSSCVNNIYPVTYLNKGGTPLAFAQNTYPAAISNVYSNSPVLSSSIKATADVTMNTYQPTNSSVTIYNGSASNITVYPAAYPVNEKINSADWFVIPAFKEVTFRKFGPLNWEAESIGSTQKKYYQLISVPASTINLSSGSLTGQGYVNFVTGDFTGKLGSQVKVYGNGLEYEMWTYGGSPSGNGGFFTITGTALRLYNSGVDITDRIYQIKVIIE